MNELINIFRRNFTIASLVFSSFYLFSCDCDGPSDVTTISKIGAQELPSEVTPGSQPQFKVIFKIDFNTDIDPTNLTAPGNINISAKGDSGNEDKDITGSVQYVSSERSIYYISTNSLGFSPGAGENITYTVQIVGVGNECVKRQTGVCIDGCDNDTAPGNNHVEKITVIG